MSKRGDLLAVLGLTAIWGLVTAVVGLGGDFPLNDDWAYAATARNLLYTGHFRVVEWAAPSLLTHALWGAAALRVMGDTYVALRCGTLLWALAALLSLYGLARVAFEPKTAVLAALALGLSPWFVSLSFTYMTDVPWLAMMLASLLAFIHALRPGSSGPPRRPLLLLSGALVGAAALTRQFAVVMAPAFVLVLALDARRRHGARWMRPAAKDAFVWCAPVLAFFVPFQLWYVRVHGATQANRETVLRMRQVNVWKVLVHLACVVHYAGLWLFPVALALPVWRRLKDIVSSRERGFGGEAPIVTRRQAIVTLVLFGGYAIGRPLAALFGAAADRPAAPIHELMPYLHNVFYLASLGPPTITGTYMGWEPMPRSGAWLGVVLTFASTIGAVVALGLFRTTVDSAWRTWHGAATRPDTTRSEMLGVLLLGACATYLLWHLATGPFLFDRYLLPALPMVVLLGLQAAPAQVPRSPLFLGWIVALAVFSLGGTREYLSWNDARDRAVRALFASGIPVGDVDGGFEVNAPRHFEAYLKRTGALTRDESFWLKRTPYRISFWPASDPACTTEARYPYWTWPGSREQAVYVVHCPAQAEEAEETGSRSR
jgi:4-amino-4-deoxy-L-arabinose transferase-like glycosyltransferase